MNPTLKRAVRSLAACTLSTITAVGLATAPAHADDFQNRADELVATYGYGSSYWRAYPTTSGPAQTEWKKGVYYSAMAVRRQEAIERAKGTAQATADANARFAESVSRLDQGLVYAGSSDMFALSGVVDYWQRFPDPQPAGQTAIWTSARITKLQQFLWARGCWNKALTTDPQYTGNKRLMLYTAALFGALNTTINQRYAGNSCGTPTLSTFVNMKLTDPVDPVTGAPYEGARAWIERFLDETVKYGFSEADSATYVGNYLQPLRLIADRYPDPELAAKADKVFDWIVANNAGEWTPDGISATSSRQYFLHDGHAGRPLTLNGYLRTAFGGSYHPTKQWETSGDVRKPWTATAVPLAFTSWRPDARVFEAATERTEAFTQRESTRMNLAKVDAPTSAAPDPLPPLARSTRSFEPGGAVVSSTTSDPVGWGSQQAQEFTVRTQEPGTNNRTLSIASPYTQTLPTATDSSINASPDLQWVQAGGAAIGASWSTTNPHLVRMLTAAGLVPSQSNWPSNVRSNGWTILNDTNSIIGIRFVTAPTANTQPGPILFGDTYAVRSNNPGSTEGNFVLVETAKFTGPASVTAFENALTAQNATISCTGINLPPLCTKPTAASRTSIQYTTLAGRTLKVAYPDTSGRAQRWIDGALQSESTWPMLENPWLQQNAPSRLATGKSGGDVLRASAITEGGPYESTTEITQYRVSPWTTTLASPIIAPGVDGRFEDAWSSSTPPGFVAANWSGRAGSYSVTATKHTGGQAARVGVPALSGDTASTNTYGNAGISLASSSRPTPTKDRATFTVWLQTTNVSRGIGHGAYISAQWVDAAGTPVCDEQTSEPVAGTSTSWISRSVTLQPKSGACSAGVKVAVSLRLRSNAGGAVVFDDLDWASHD